MHPGNGFQKAPTQQRIHILPHQFAFRLQLFQFQSAVERRESGLAGKSPLHHFLIFFRLQGTSGVHSLPPAATRCIAARRIASCRPCKSARSFPCNRHLISGLCARVPVPEQGTSVKTQSNPVLGAKSSTSELITSTFVAGTSCRSNRARCACSSRAIIVALGFCSPAPSSCRRARRNNPGFSSPCQPATPPAARLRPGSRLGPLRRPGCGRHFRFEPGAPKPVTGRAQVRSRRVSIPPPCQGRRNQSWPSNQAGPGGKSATPVPDRNAAPSAQPAKADAPASRTALPRFQTSGRPPGRSGLQPYTHAVILARGFSRCSQLTQHGIGERSSRSLAGALDQVHTLVHHGPRGNPVKKHQLICRQPQSGEHFDVEFSDALVRESTDFGIQRRPPPYCSITSSVARPWSAGESFAYGLECNSSAAYASCWSIRSRLSKAAVRAGEMDMDCKLS